MIIESNNIYLGDYLKLIWKIPDKSVDLILTDPPYGKNTVENSNRLQGLKYRPILNDNKMLDLSELMRVSKKQVIFGGNYFHLPISSGWIVWDKQGGKKIDFGDCELIWTSFEKPARIITHIWDGFRRDSEWGIKRIHPAQKPVELIQFLINTLSNEGDLILDPFLGSGTTAVACIRTGRQYIGMEIDRTYFEIAKKRIEEEKRQAKLRLFNPYIKEIEEKNKKLF